MLSLIDDIVDNTAYSPWERQFLRWRLYPFCSLSKLPILVFLLTLMRRRLPYFTPVSILIAIALVLGTGFIFWKTGGFEISPGPVRLGNLDQGSYCKAFLRMRT